MFRPIHHTFAPLADGRFCAQALGLIFRPWLWRRGNSIGELRSALREHFAADAFLFASGREGLLALFRAMNIGLQDEIIVQAYTCVVVPNAITAAGATPVFVDIVKDTLSMDPEELRKKITPRTKAIICQHTFGIPAPLEELRAICHSNVIPSSSEPALSEAEGSGERIEGCNEHQIPLIEDCAHIIADERGPDGIGMTGDFVMLSFGRDKAISGVTGGAIILRGETQDDNRTDVSNRLQLLEQSSVLCPLSSVLRLLLYPLLYAVARPFYGLWIGKAFLKLCSIIGLLPSILTSGEKSGHQSPTLHRLPNACAALALRQLKELQEINDHRRMLTRFYLEKCAEHGWPVLHGIRSDLPLQKFPMFVEDAERIRRSLKKKNIHLNDGWTGCVVCPPSVDQSIYPMNDPRAEEIGQQILSLPTHPGITLRDAETLVQELRVESPQ